MRRIAALKGELAELKTKLEPKPEPNPRKPWPKIDYTEGMGMPASAVKPMADLINPRGLKYDPNAWRGSYPEPGGFGAPAKAKPVRNEPEVTRGSGWVDPTRLECMVRGRWSKRCV